jgi:hypothetical protein
MQTRTYIAALVTMMTSAVIFGIGTTVVLSIPTLSKNAATLLPIVIATSFIVGPIVGWALAPRLRSRWQREHAKAVLRQRYQSKRTI